MTTNTTSKTCSGWLRRTIAVASAAAVLAAPLAASAGDDDRDFRRGGQSRGDHAPDGGGRRGGEDRNPASWGRGDRRDPRPGGWAGWGDRSDWRAEGHRGQWQRDGRGQWGWHRDDGHGGSHGRWDYEPRHGWRYERGVDVWSPFYAWWWLDGRTVLAVAPTVTILRYRTGYYTLQGDGIVTPYYWGWTPTFQGPPPPPPGPPEFAPDAMLDDSAPDTAPYAAARPSGDRQAAGTIFGGAVGGLLGSALGHGPGRVGGIIVGTLLGALVGHDVARSLDEADELHAARVLEKNRTGQGSSWVNPDTGAEVTVLPRRTYQTRTGEYCREYQTEVTLEGQKQQAYGKACRQPDGQWKIVE